MIFLFQFLLFFCLFVLWSVCSRYILHAQRIHFSYFLCVYFFHLLVAEPPAIRLARFMVVFRRVSCCPQSLLVVLHLHIYSFVHVLLRISMITCTREFIRRYWVIFNYFGTHKLLRQASSLPQPHQINSDTTYYCRHRHRTHRMCTLWLGAVFIYVQRTHATGS